MKNKSIVFFTRPEKDGFFLLQLFFLLLFHTLINLAWHNANEVFHGKDASLHLNNLSYFLRILEGELRHYYYNTNHSFLYNIIFIGYDWPPFYYYISGLLYKIFFPFFGYKSIYTASHFFFLLAITYLYKVSRVLFGEKTALFSAFLFSFFPLNYISSRHYNLEIATVAGVLMCHYYFLKSRWFTLRKYSVILGIIAGISFLIKNVVFFPLIGNLLWFINQGKKKNADFDQKTAIINLIIFFSIMICIALVYYGNKSYYQYKITRIVSEMWHQPLWNSLIDYLRLIFYRVLGIGPSVCFLLSLIYCFKESVLRKIILYWVALPFVLFLIPFHNMLHQAEFLMPVFAPAAIIIAASINKIQTRLLKYAVTAALITVVLIQFLAASFMLFELFMSNYSFVTHKLIGFYAGPRKCSAYEDMFIYLQNDIKNGGSKIGLTGQTKDTDLGLILRTAFHLRKKPWKIISSWTEEEEFYERLEELDYLIYITQKDQDSLEKDLKLKALWGKFKLKRIYSFSLDPKYTSVLVYKKLF